MKFYGCLFVSVLMAAPLFHGCHQAGTSAAPQAAGVSYDAETDWTDTQKTIPLGYLEAQGKRVFYQYCVWCHADASPAGPSNRSNLTPMPALLNDGSVLNNHSDEYLQNMITLGGSAMGKSAMMPPYGGTLTPDDIRAVIAFARAVAQPPYQPPVRPGSQYSPK
jgi:mono/diheme cytochrome c family protein